MARTLRIAFAVVALGIFGVTTFAFGQGTASGTKTVVVPAGDDKLDLPEDPSQDTLEQRLERMKEYKKATRERTKRLVNESLESTLDDELEDAIQQRASEIEVEQAEKKARKRVAKYDTPAMKKARKEIMDRENDLRVAYRDQFETKKSTALSCPNPDDSQRVFIHPSMKHGFDFILHSRMTITNNTPYTIHIRRNAGGGVTNIVSNLCPGGTLSLFERPILLSSSTTIVQYMAVGASGETLYNEVSPELRINPCNGIGCQLEFPGRWVIETRK